MTAQGKQDKPKGQIKQGKQDEQAKQTSPFAPMDSVEPALCAEPIGPDTLDVLDTSMLPKPAFFQSFKDVLLGKNCILDCIQVEVTSICGGCCSYCPHTTASDSWRSRNMADATFIRLWPLMLESQRVHLQGWGEPFLHPRFLDYVKIAREAGCQVSSTTCGLHMDDTLAKSIVESGMDIVAFSLAGTDNASNALRVGVPFEHVIEAIERLQYWRKRLQGVHLEIHLAYLLLAPAMEALQALPELMQKLGIHATALRTLDYLALPEHASLAFAVNDREKIAKAHALIQEVRTRIEEQGAAFDATLPGEHLAHRCRENSARTTYIDADGLMSPCSYLNVPQHFDVAQHHIIGNIITDNPLDLWHSSQYTSFRDVLSGEAPDGLCQQCSKRHETSC